MVGPSGTGFPRGFSVQGSYGPMYPMSNELYDNPELNNTPYPPISKHVVFTQVNQRLQSGMNIKQSINAVAKNSRITAKEILELYTEYKQKNN